MMFAILAKQYPSPPNVISGSAHAEPMRSFICLGGASDKKLSLFPNLFCLYVRLQTALLRPKYLIAN